VAKKLSKDLESLAVLKHLEEGNQGAADKKLAEINASGNHKYTYSSGHDYYLCTSFERVGHEKFESDVLSPWLQSLVEHTKDSTKREAIRQTVLNGAFGVRFLEDKVGLDIRGFRRRNADKIRGMIREYSKLEEGGAKAVAAEIRLLVREQEQGKGMSSEKLTELFREMILKADENSPQAAVLKGFGDYDNWVKAKQAGKEDEATKLLEQALTSVRNLAAEAKIEPEGREELIEFILSDGSVDATYIKMRQLADSGNGERILENLTSLEVGSKAFEALRYDIKLLEALKAKTIPEDGFFTRTETIKKAKDTWAAIMARFNLPPSGAELQALKEKDEATLLKLQEIANVTILPDYKRGRCRERSAKKSQKRKKTWRGLWSWG
jgi:hypothetical protein